MTVWAGPGGAASRRVTVTVPDDCPRQDRRCDLLAARLGDALGVPGDALVVRGRLLEASALLGDPPLLDGVSVRLVDGSRWSPPRATAASAATEVAVVGGPDAGGSRPLTAGTHTVGRSGADLTLGDPSLSRRHLRLDVGASGVCATDLGSENGTLLDGEPLGASTPLGTGAVMRLGHTTLAFRPARTPPVRTSARGDGTLLVDRVTSPLPEPPAACFTLPIRPEAPSPRRVPWPAVLIPLPVAAVLAWLVGPHLLLLGLMSPLMLLATLVSDRMGARRTHARALREHEAAVTASRRRLDAALIAERAWLERAHPDLASLASAATTPGPLLWSRSPHPGLALRIGLGAVESMVRVVEEGETRRPTLDHAPVTVDLLTHASLAVGGPLAVRVGDALIGRLLVLHSPRELVVWTDRPAWSLAPHARVGRSAELLRDAVAAVARRQEEARAATGPDARPVIVLALDMASGTDVELEAMALLQRDGAACGIHIIRSGPAPPTQADVRIETSASGQGVLVVAGRGPIPLTLDGASPDWVRRVCDGLAPLRDPGGGHAGLPDRVSLADALAAAGIEPTADGIERQWSRAGDGARVTFGVGEEGVCGLDLATAGPHVLVGGTTGSGKSALLRTVVASLAAAHPPEDLCVVLVDYKGGSAFAGLEPLPHIVGVVTDLDPALTARALTSLRAEIHRRERLFARCGATDIAGYRAQSRGADSRLPHLARLVIVTDEFRALADELPEFVAGLVRIAAVGRSLGIHLVLATQRPAGVVTADMRANLGLRVALRVRDRTDSQDVIESDAAAGLPVASPGRALMRWGREPLVAFQTATIESPDAAADVVVEIGWSDGTSTTRRFPVTDGDSSRDLVAAIAAAARRPGHGAPPSPWLPPLPASVSWDPSLPPGAWAIRDDPLRQRQEPLVLDLSAAPHVAIAGGLGSGRSTTVLTLVTAALSAQGHHLHVHVVADPAGPLADLATLPHTGAFVDRADPAQVAAFVERLAAEVRSRRSTADPTTVLVVIDGWDTLVEASDVLDHGACTDRLLATLREGYALGLRAVVTGDRSVLTGRVGRSLPERLLLRPADPADLALAGVPPSCAPATWPPGRVVRVGDQAELQVLRPRANEDDLPPPASAPWRITLLPLHLELGALPDPPPGSGAVHIGCSSESPDPVSVGAPGRRRVVVVGSSGAGRSEALAVIGVQAARAGRRVCVVADAHEQLAERLTLSGVAAERLAWEDDDDLVRLRRTHPDLVVLADDVDRHAESPLVPVLARIADLAERDGGLVVVAGDGASMAMRPRGVGAVVARARVGVVLGAPTPLDGDLLGVRLPRIREVLPGRGWLVADRRVSPVQLAVLDASATPGPSGSSSRRRRR